MLRKSVRRRRFSAGAAGPQTHAQGGPHVWPARRLPLESVTDGTGHAATDGPRAERLIPIPMTPLHPQGSFPAGEDGTLRNAALRLQEGAV